MRVRTRCRLIPVLVGSLHLVACGGSSSETPEPVRPDSWQLKLRHQRLLSSANQADTNRAMDRDESFQRTPPAQSTWGTNRAGSAKPELAAPEE